MPPPPLTSVLVVLRNDSLGSLPHVVAAVSQCLDRSEELSLACACTIRSILLLQRIWDRSATTSAAPATDENEVVQGPFCWSPARFLRTDPHYYRAQFSRGLKEAARLEDVGMIHWLFAHFSGCVAGVQAVEAAASAGNLHLLQLFLEYEHAERVRTGEGVQGEGNTNQVRWGGGDLAVAARNGHLDVVRWLYVHKGDAERDWGRFITSVVRTGDVTILTWLLDHGYGERQFVPPPSMDDAAWGGHLDMLQWLYGHGYVHHGSFALENSARNGHLKAVEWLVRHHPVGNATRALVAAAKANHLPVVRWLLEHNQGRGAKSAIHQAAIRGHLEVAQYIHAQGLPGLAGVSCGTMVHAAERGFLEVVKWLNVEFADDVPIDLYKDLRTTPLRMMHGGPATAMDAAARNGHFEVLKFLHGVGLAMGVGGCNRPMTTPDAMDGAAAGNYGDIVEWLGSHRSSGCTVAAMDNAATNGHLQMVKWLHENRTEGCTTAAIDGAARNGHLDVVKWLHHNRFEGCTTKAMDGAAGSGAFEVVQWLHCNRSEGCTTEAMNSAAGA
ncbi:hypothetical protein BBJ28_00025512, partial [Nothophytophthora sp. Chile5]